MRHFLFRSLPVFFLLLVSCAFSQTQEVKHAPTVAQCRADQRLWLSKLEEPNDAGEVNVNYYEFSAWGHEMGDCMHVDPEFARQYDSTWGEAIAAQLRRVEHFLDRHNQWGQFYAEEAQGKR